ncbi:ribosome maturation factor RimP [Aliidiomarina halalkaliphila]|uniref:Ribosome maturation factor RimP n=1 Tax=Aliidiomarina halalkaliphila TaxID=2593535 RepID=A0A552X349_9GAMM|nr:ribosome maturation factor RimP [Aliidiomarina halalkaliphila]TRW49396.1 ribosome maturation factor RimP [Aliidiomarina halalkaliphila]
MATLVERLTDMLEPAVSAAGYELVGIEFVRAKTSILRVYIDHENGISVDDCADVSHQVSAVLDVEDPISTEYTLEVSSPGMDRPLFNIHHFERFIGEEASVQLTVAIENKRNFKAVITAVEGDKITFTLGNESLNVPVSAVKKANLVPKFD